MNALFTDLTVLLAVNRAAAEQAHWEGRRAAGDALDAVCAELQRRINDGEAVEPNF